MCFCMIEESFSKTVNSKNEERGLQSFYGSTCQLYARTLWLKGGTHITIIRLILLRFYPFLTTGDYFLSYKIVLYDYPVVCGVL